MTTPINIERVAKLVGNREDVTATPREREIAAKVRRVGQKLERDGYLPELRRAHMAKVLREEAALDGYKVPLCACGSTEAKLAPDETSTCAKCGKSLDGPMSP